MKIHIEIPAEIKQLLDELRERKGTPLSWMVNRAIRNYLKAKKVVGKSEFQK